MVTVSPGQTATRLENPRQITILRAAWLLIVALSLVIIVQAVPIAYNSTLHFAATDLTNELAQLGLSPQFHAIYYLTLQIVIALAYFSAAGLMFWRKPNDWLVMLVALAFATAGPSTGVCGCWLAHEQDLWRFPVFLIGVIGDIATVLVIYLFPDGKLSPRWMRWGIPIYVLWQGGRSYVSTMGQTPLPGFIETISSLLIIVVYVIGLIAQLYRYRRQASAVQKQQSKWVIGGLAVIILGLVGDFVIGNTLYPKMTGANLLLYWWSVFFTFNFLPTLVLIITVVFAMLRYRLWDIDFAINRSLVYGALTFLLLGLFVILLTIISKIFQNYSQGPLTAVAGSALVFGVIFQPARHKLQRFVDQRFYNIQIDYQKASPDNVLPTADTRHTFGPYSGLQLIGRGGMGEVYKAQHPTLNHPVAIKILPASLANESDFRKRFEREIKMVAALHHPHIVQVLESGEVGDAAYMVMEYLNGPDLAEYLRKHGRMSLQKALPIITGIAAALDYAHQQGFVHRDIKPSNVMLDGTRPVLTDFGIAKILGSHTAMTGTGNILGTLDYIAPEQIQAAAEVDGRADVYAFGIMIFQMLTGELPFKHNNPGALLIAHLTQPPPNPCDLVPTLPESVAYAIQHALAKRPEERFPTAGELVTALDEKVYA